MIDYLKIGEITIALEHSFHIDWTFPLTQFLTNPIDNPHMTYHFIIKENLEPLLGHIVYQSLDCTILNINGKEYNIFTLPNSGEPYSFSYFHDKKNCFIYILKEFEPYLKGNRILFQLIPLDQLLLEHNSIVLHSSFVVHNETAILFSAPSGTGKSTQANLWHKVLGSTIINGDRSLLVNIHSQWFAYGYPLSGSSNVEIFFILFDEDCFKKTIV